MWSGRGPPARPGAKGHQGTTLHAEAEVPGKVPCLQAGVGWMPVVFLSER